MRADDVQGIGSLMRQGETLHATESLWRATGRRTPARHLPFPVSWQTCGLRVGGAARKAKIQFSLNIRQNPANCRMFALPTLPHSR